MREQEFFVHRTYTDAQIAGGLQLIPDALLAALFAATFVAEFTAARFPEMSFVQRFVYAFSPFISLERRIFAFPV